MEFTESIRRRRKKIRFVRGIRVQKSAKIVFDDRNFSLITLALHSLRPEACPILRGTDRGPLSSVRKLHFGFVLFIGGLDV
jgi:hypothetical protein